MGTISPSAGGMESLEISAPSFMKIWVLAIRPATLSAAIAPVCLGCAFAFLDGEFNPVAALAILVCAVLIQIGTNLYNDYADYEKGADTPGRLGPDRVTQKGWLSPKVVKRAAYLTLFTAILIGTYLVAMGGWPILVIGLLSVACAVLYTGGPFPLGYHGLGDLFVWVFFGLIAVSGTYYVQALSITPEVVMAGAALGLLTTAILVVNNLRDRQSDEIAQKRTLVVRFGHSFGRWEYLLCLSGAYLISLYVYWNTGDWGWLLTWLSLPLAIRSSINVCSKDGAALNPQLGATALLGLIYSFLLSVGVNL
jgi:1,4-dihydroxy-2-naphthoate octaprenyltransferase